MKLTVCWTARGRNKRFYHDICRKFGISDYMSVNHETPCDIKDEDMELLRECEKRGFLQIRKKQWIFRDTQFSAPGESKTKEHFPDAGDVRCSTEDIRFILHGG